MKSVIATAAALCTCALVVGCGPYRVPPPGQGTPHLGTATVVDESGQSTAGAVERARNWSKKYSSLAEKYIKVQEDNRTLTDKNRQLAGQVEKLGAQLAQARKELREANAMLSDMNNELAQWKRDVLGFREEIRRAQQAQMGLMTKMVRLLGGEVPEVVAKAKEQSDDTAQ